MNEIETKFYDAFLAEEDDAYKHYLEPQPVVGIYRPDFRYERIIIEIDGHEYHKTKEQREKDYRRERYFIRKGYTVIRFMATEVFLCAERCVEEVWEIIGLMDEAKSRWHDWALGAPVDPTVWGERNE